VSFTPSIPAMLAKRKNTSPRINLSPPSHTSSRLTSLPTLILPIHPTALVLGNILIPILPRQVRRRRAPHARFAIKHQLLLERRLAEAKTVLELGFVQEHGVGLGFDRDVDRAGDETGLVLGGLADVCSVLVSELVITLVRCSGVLDVPIMSLSGEGELANSLIWLKS
jgi:hypothetical protein